jgi:hypothetical protein
LGAWDAPSKAYKWFVDRHFTENLSAKKWFLPTNLGWWCIFDWTPKDRVRTFPDDVEYLMCKSLASDSSLSWLMGFDPEKFSTSYNQKKLASLVKQYEELRLSNYFPESVKRKLAQPGQDFTLESAGGGQWQLRPVRYDKHKIAGVDGQSNIWKTQNPYGPQPIKLRIEAMLSLADYEDAENVILAEFKEPKEFSDTQSSAEVTCKLGTTSNRVKIGSWSGSYSAKNNQSDPTSAWSMVSKSFASDVDLSQCGFGVWIYGDGNGEILNFLWKTPSHISVGISEHYAVIDFLGWRYFEFVEPESDSVGDYKWPYHQDSGVPYKETFWVDYSKLNSLSLGYVHLPKGKEVKCYLSPIKALPHIKAKLVNPSVTVNGSTLHFPVEVKSGYYLEFHSMHDCKLYNSQGELISQITPQGEVPFLQTGDNQIQYNCTVSPAARARANVTVITHSDTVLQR